MANKAQLIVSSSQTYFNNNNGGIVPDTVNAFNTNWINSSVLNDDTGSFMVTASFSSGVLTFTKADNSTFSIVIPDVSGSALPAGVISGSQQIAQLGYVQSSVTASSLVTASVNVNQITFTKGDGTTFSVTVNVSGSVVSASYADIANFANSSTSASYAFTASSATNAFSAVSSSYALTASFALNAPTINTGSFVTTSSFNAASSSLSTRVTSLEEATGSYATTSSLAAVSSSLQSRTTALENASASFSTRVTDNTTNIQTLTSATASYAVLANNQTFTGKNTFNNDVTASNVRITGTASIAFLDVTFQSSSVIYSSGSNQFGDAANDTQTLYGTVNVITGPLVVTGSSNFKSAFTASGLNYPNVDGLEGQVIKTDGTNDLAFGDVNTIFETVYTGENITKSDPLYISGSQGANPIVYKADAANAAKMPVTYVASETIAAGNTTRGIVLGLIEGIDLTGYTEGTEVYVAAGGGWTSTRPTGSAIVQILGIVTKGGAGGKGLVLNPGPVDLPNLQAGYAWVGDANGVPQAVSTSSLLVTNALSSSFAATASFTPNAIVSAATYIISSSIKFDRGEGAADFVIVDNVQSASYADNANTANSATTATNATSASYAFTASSAISSSFASVAATVLGTITSASFATSASRAISAESATSASFAISASRAISADSSTTSLSGSSVLVDNYNGINSTYYLTMVDNASGYKRLGLDTDLSYNPSTNILSATVQSAASASSITIDNYNGSNTTYYLTMVDNAAGFKRVGLDTDLAYNPSTNLLTGLITSASFATSASRAINADTASLAPAYTTTSSFNTASGSLSTRVTNLEAFSSSLDATFATDAYVLQISQSLSQSFAAGQVASASYSAFALTASYVAGAVAAFPFTGSAGISGSLDLVGALYIPSGSLEITGSATIISGSLTMFSYKTTPASNRSFEALVTQSLNSTNNIISVNINSANTGSIVISGSGNYVSLASVAINTQNTQGLTSGFSGTNAYVTLLPGTTGSNPNFNTTADRNNRRVPQITNSNVNATITVNDNRASETSTPFTLNQSSNNMTATVTLQSGSLSVSNSQLLGAGTTFLVSGSGTIATNASIANSIISTAATSIITFNVTSSGVSQINNSILVGPNLRLSLTGSTPLNSTAVANPSLIDSILVGRHLVVTGSSASSTTTANIAVFGGFNTADGLLNDGRFTRFAIGTGASDASRRTSFHVSASGLTTIANGLIVSGSAIVEALSGSFSGSGANIFGVVSSSYALTASFLEGSIASASFAENANTASFTPNAFISASNPTAQNNQIEFYKDGSIVSTNTVTIDNVQSASYADNATSASFATNASTASFLLGSIASASFAETSVTASFATNFVNSGSYVITGSHRGNVVSQSIASSTASFDFGTGNFFTLNLTGSTLTHISASNIQAGQTVNLRISQGATTGSVSFSPVFKQVSGSVYTPTAVANAVDVVTFITFDSTNVYVSNIKNLI